MSTAKKYQYYTFDEFCTLVPEGQKADLIDGIIQMASPDNIEHHDIIDWLSQIVGLFMEEADQGGKKIGSRIALRLDQRNGPEPDFGYICEERIHIVQRTYVDGPADWVVEVVSPESVHRDYVSKRKQYEKAGVKEYWIIDPMTEKVTVLRLGKEKKYRQIRATQGILRCQQLPGFWIKADWLWQQPQPKILPTLSTILEGRK